VAVAARRMVEDENNEPQYGDRVPYVIIRGEPQARLLERAVAPEEMFTTRYVHYIYPSLLLTQTIYNRYVHLDGAYYISRVLIPPLERIFNLVGADVRAWYDEMPKRIRADQPDPVVLSPRKGVKEAMVLNRPTIDEHFRSNQCFACGSYTTEGELRCALRTSVHILMCCRDLRRVSPDAARDDDWFAFASAGERRTASYGTRNMCYM